MGAPRTAAIAATGLFVLVGATGPSAATPGFTGPGRAAAGVGAGTVTAELLLAYLLAGLALWWSWAALRRGEQVWGREAPVVAVLGVLAFVAVAPFGSADHLSYAAYGRIAALGGDPYLVSPQDFRGGHDPVLAAALNPWRDTTSVYGPVAGAMQEVGARWAGDSVRSAVRLWQLLAGVCFLLTGALLDLFARRWGADRQRVLMLWTLNPLLLALLVGGAHLDVVPALGVAVALLCGTSGRLRGPPGVALLALVGTGAGLALAVGTKVPYLVVAPALLWAHRDVPPRRVAASAAVVGATTVALLVPFYLAAGPHVLDQLTRAGRYISLATPWRPLDLAARLLGGDLRPWLLPLTAALAVVVLLALVRAVAPAPTSDGARATGPEAARALALLATAYLLTSAYVLPWYDAMVLLPLAVIAVDPVLDGVVLARLMLLSVVYVPGLVGDESMIAAVMLDLRLGLAPALLTLLLGWVLVRGRPARVRTDLLQRQS